MSRHWKYLKSLSRHKWFVFLECCKLGIPWRGIVHDLNKLHPAEWFPYAALFYGGYRPLAEIPYGARYYEVPREDIEYHFNLAWLRHQHHAPHHWQHWVLRLDDGGTLIMEMPYNVMKEMLADWRGAGRAYGTPDTAAWYRERRDRIMLAPSTRRWIERELGITAESEAMAA